MINTTSLLPNIFPSCVTAQAFCSSLLFQSSFGVLEARITCVLFGCRVLVKLGKFHSEQGGWHARAQGITVDIPYMG